MELWKERERRCGADVGFVVCVCWGKERGGRESGKDAVFPGL